MTKLITSVNSLTDNVYMYIPSVHTNTYHCINGLHKHYITFITRHKMLFTGNWN